jgi:hypothetical protein
MSRIVPRGGHFPGHVRDSFLYAIHAFVEWEEGASEPVVYLEHQYVLHPVTLSTMCGLLWNCTDILPDAAVQSLLDCDIDLRSRRTYAAAAREMKVAIGS